MYALRRKRDGKLMPGFKGRAGGTYVNPDDPNSHTGTPRLFTTSKAAGDALRWWSKGYVRVRDVQIGHPLDAPEFDQEWSTDPVAGRNAEEWEVVTVEVRVME